MGSPEPVPAGTLDLSLPTDEELLAASAPNPYLERDRVKQGNVAEILDLAADFAAAGGDMTAAAEYSLEAQRYLAENFTNDGTPVYDQATHLAALPKDFFDAGPRMIQLSRRLDLIADDLDTTQNQADTTWTTMLDSLDAKRAAFATQVQAALNAQGLIPFAAVAGLLATRDTYASFMQVDVNAAGSTMDKRRKTYEATLADGMKLLADFGYIPPDELDAGPGEPEYTPGGAAADGAALDAIVDDVTANGADLATLPAITATLDQIARLNAAEAAGATLTHDQQLYRQQFYDALGPESLARLEGTITAAAPTQTALDTTLATAANGITNLSRYQDGAHVPQAVTALLPGQTGPDGALNRLGTAGPASRNTSDRSHFPTRNDDGTWTVDGLAEYQGITGLLDNATAPAGSTFLTTLGESAIAAKQDLNGLVPPPEAFEGDMYDRAAQDAVAAQLTAGEAASNTLLGMVAGDTLASQDLITDTDNRHALLGAGWTDGTGAAAVIDTATAPAQPSPAAALRSAELSRTLITELGDNPQAWRELIPKGSAVSNSLTQLGIERIGSFATSPTADSSFDGFSRTPDGQWIGDITIGKGPDDRVGGEGIDYIKFLAAGSDPTNPAGDLDIQSLRVAAQGHSTDTIAAAVGGPDVRGALGDAGGLRGMIDQGQYEALIDQNTEAAAANGAVAKDGIYSARAAARVFAETVVGELPGGGIAKQLFNLTADEFANRTGTPDPTAGQDGPHEFSRENKEWRTVTDNHLLATALARTDPTFADRNSQLFDANGHLLPLEQIGARTGLQEVLEVAVREPSASHPDWEYGRTDLRNSYEDYESGSYQQPTDAPPASLDGTTRRRILTGDRP